MSSFAAGYIASVREQSPRGASRDDAQPGVKTFLDAFAALVPAEVLVAHGAILAATTKLTSDAEGKATTTITDPTALRFAFWGLAAVAILLYLGGRVLGARSKNQTVKWDRGDLVRALIPALAFVGWTILQSPTAFDALGVTLTEGLRVAVAVVGGLALGVIAALLAYQLDQKDATAPPATDDPGGTR